MVYNEYYMFNTWEKQLVMYIGSAIGIGFFLNNEYRISENGKILISVHLYLEDNETPQSGKASQPVGENGRKETLPDAKTSSEGETDRITELAEKAGSTLDPVTVDQVLLQSLRQKYQ